MGKREIEPIAYIHTDFKEKFGVPRQGGRAPNLKGKIIFEHKFRNEESLFGLDEFSHIWLIFDFSRAHRDKWSPTVRPPRLGGNKRVGVFASRSPFRPNSLGISSVRLESIEKTVNDGIVLNVAGIDLIDKTPIYDIKPYLPYTDIHKDAKGSYGDEMSAHSLKVNFPEDLLNLVPYDKQEALIECLKDDPRPSYISDISRIYKMNFANLDVHFSVDKNILTVLKIEI